MNNELFGKVKRPTEAVIDGRTMNLLGNTLNEVTRSANRGVSAFDTIGFLTRVAAKLAPNAVADDEDGSTADGRRQRRRVADDDAHAAGWAAIGRMAAKHTCRIPVADFMLGPLSLPPKVKKPRKPVDVAATQQRKKNKNVPQTQPQNFDAAAQEAEPETSREVQRIHRLLSTQGGEQGVPFFKFICHPDSFARSVENLFHLSFLRACDPARAMLTVAVKEGKATLDKDDESDGPIVSTLRWRDRKGRRLTHPVVCQPPDEEQKTQAAAADEAIVHTSVMFEFTHAIWKEAVERYEINEAMIPHK